MFLFLSTCGILRVPSCSGNLCFQWLFIFIVSHFDIFTEHSNVIKNWDQIYVQSFRWTYERGALPYSFPSCQELFAILVFVDSTSCAQIEIEDAVFGVDWNELFLPYQLTYVSTCILISWPMLLCTGIVKPPPDPKIEIVSSVARDFSGTAQHLVCTAQTVFHLNLETAKLHHQESIHHWQSDKTSISCFIWTEVQWTCVHCRCCVQLLSH